MPVHFKSFETVTDLFDFLLVLQSELLLNVELKKSDEVSLIGLGQKAKVSVCSSYKIINRKHSMVVTKLHCLLQY